jgi:peptidyl-prolyl cis-trans isomerase C
MRRVLPVALGALLLGVGSGECLTRNFSFRHWISHIVRHEQLQALVGRHGIYERDVERAWQAELFGQGAEAQDVASSTVSEEKQAALDRLIALEKLNDATTNQRIEAAALEREMNLLRWQMPDEKAWQQLLRRAAINPRQLQSAAARNLRERNWLESQVAPRIQPNDDECRRYFETHRVSFAAPPRLRASHLFLAAPEGYPDEVIETKRALIGDLAKRLANGEAFPALVAEFSEDEATKKRGGDLGFFATERMLPAVFEAAQRLQPGETSAPIRSRLGFHIIRLTETRPARALTFEEARPEIMIQLENQKRAEAVAGMVAGLR